MLTINHPITGDAHTLLPHNGWGDGSAIKWKKRRQSAIGTGILGNENRAALRALALHEISCKFVAESLQERSRLNARIDQATKSGFACIAFFGKATTISANANAGTNSLTLNGNPLWTWQAGDYVILLGADDSMFDCIAVNNVAGAVLTLAGNLQFTWPAGAKVWPLMFGKFSAQAEGGLNAANSSIQITISENTAARNAQVGITPAPGIGIGQQVVGRTNKLL